MMFEVLFWGFILCSVVTVISAVLTLQDHPWAMDLILVRIVLLLWYLWFMVLVLNWML